MEEKKIETMVTQKGKLVYSSGTVKRTSDGRKYIVVPDGSWRRLDKLQRRVMELKEDRDAENFKEKT